MRGGSYQISVKIALAIVVMVVTTLLLGFTFGEKLLEMASGQRIGSGETVYTNSLCKYLEGKVGYLPLTIEAKSTTLDQFSLNLLSCFGDSERAKIGTPSRTMAASCPADKDGFNIYLLGPSESHNLAQGHTYEIVVEKSAGPWDAYPDACIKATEAS